MSTTVRPTTGVDVDLDAKPVCDLPGCGWPAIAVLRYKCGCSEQRCWPCIDQSLASIRKLEKKLIRRRQYTVPFECLAGHEWLLRLPGIERQIVDVVAL